MSFFSFYKQKSDTFKTNPAIMICASFLVPFLLLLLCATALQLVPLGNKHSLAISDGKWYLNGLMFFKRLLSGEENFFYSLKNGLGGNEWAGLAWGGIAPASVLVIFADYETLPAWFTWICFVNMSLCGVSIYILLSKIYGHKFSHLLFSTTYALIGFNTIYCHEYLFFIGVQLLPIVVLGELMLLNNQTPIIYIGSLGICIFLNFYFGFMLCIVSVIILLAWLYLNTSQRKETTSISLRWLLSSIVAGLLGAPMWLPALKAYSGGGRLNQTELTEYTFSEKSPFIQIFAKLFTGTGTQSEMINGLPNIFCGILVLSLVILYFNNKLILKRKKTVSAVILGFYLISFYLPAFTILMHGGTHTNWFPYRYSFIFSFWLILIAAEQYQYLDTITLEDCKKTGAILLLCAILIFSTKYEFITGGAIILDFAILALMYYSFYLYKTKPESASKRMLAMILLFLVCGNMYTNFVITIQNLRKDEWELDLNAYHEQNTKYVPMVQALNEKEDTFFRMEKGTSDSSSVGADSLLYGYNGISHSGPTERAFIHKGLNRLGINWFDMRHWYSDQVPASVDALLGLKYIISKKDLEEIKGYESLITLDNDSLYQSPYCLSAAFLTEKTADSIELSNNPFNNLNLIWKNASGLNKNIFSIEDNVTFSIHNDFWEQSVTTQELQESLSAASSNSQSASDSLVDNTKLEEIASTYIEYSFTAKQDGTVYYFDTSIPDSPDGLHSDVMICCGFHHTGDKVTGKIPLTGTYATGDFLRGYCQNLVFAYEDLNILKDCSDKIVSRDITMNVIKDNDIEGTFTAESGQKILFTIPWDEGWTCYIDGETVSIDKTWDLFMSVDVPEGNHTFTMKFFPAWMNYGLYLSAIALIGLIIIMISWKKQTDKHSNPTGIIKADGSVNKPL